MYGNVGLMTPRGSGTSGYVQRNLSFIKHQNKTKEDFLKEMNALKENILPPPKKANPDIVRHEQKREILVQLEKMRAELEDRGMSDFDIEERVAKAEKILNQKFESGDFNVSSGKDSHLEAQAKQAQYEKLKTIFAIDKNYKPGQSFDFETQELKRLEKLSQQEEKLQLLKQQKKEEKKKEKKAEKLRQKELKKLNKHNKKEKKHSDDE